MPNKGFTKVDNLILLDSTISLEAKGLYAILKHLSTIPDFKISREYVKSISGYGETAFRRVWKELKVKGMLIETKLRSKGKYVYAYILKTSETTTKAKAPVEKKHVDSDGNTPLDGQVNIDDVLDQEVPAVSEDIKTVVETTEFTTTEATELLNVAESNVIKIMEAYKYVKAQENVKNIFSYTKWAIKNIKSIFEPIKRKEATKSTFNNFKQRQYDFKELEMQLLYGIKSKSLYL